MSKITFNVDSTSLGHSACILNYVRTTIGELEHPEEGAYREKCLSINLVYGIAVHGFLDTMFKTSGYYPDARKKASELFAIPSIPDKKKAWMSDPRHLMTTCNMVWSSYVEEEKTYEIVSCPVKCMKCDGVGRRIHPEDPDLFEICNTCAGTTLVEGPATEINFSIPYYEDEYIIVNLQGTIDTIGKFKNGCYAIRDWKTTGSWDNDGYFQQYQLSRQLRFYVMCCKLMAQKFPDSTLGKIGSTNIGAFIDAIFLKANANETICSRSDVYQFKEKDLLAFQLTVDDFIHKVSAAVKTGYLPKEGILNGTCEQKFSKCKFWHSCKADENVASVLLARDFTRKLYTPLHFND